MWKYIIPATTFILGAATSFPIYVKIHEHFYENETTAVVEKQPVYYGATETVKVTRGLYKDCEGAVLIPDGRNAYVAVICAGHKKTLIYVPQEFLQATED